VCGIIGFVKNKNYEENLRGILQIQEHRGTDSYGAVFWYGNKGYKAIKELKKEKFLQKFDKIAKSNYKFVIVHHRWASIGNVNLKLAHPITKKDVAIIHNGTKKSLYELYKNKLQSDTEVIAYLASVLGFKNQVFRELMDGTGVIFGFDKERVFFHHDNKRSLFLNETGDLISSEPILKGNWQLIQGQYNFGFKTWEYFVKKLKFAKNKVMINNGEYLFPEYCHECGAQHLHTEEEECVVCKALGRAKKYSPYYYGYNFNNNFDNKGVDLVFVYGTLKRNFGNHYIMKEAGGKFKRNAMTLDNLYIMGGGGIPYVNKSNKDAGKIKGELYKVKNFAPLDELEGHPTFYKRELVEVVKENGEIIKAWMYIYTGKIEPRLDWKKGGCYEFPNYDYYDNVEFCEFCGEEIKQSEIENIDSFTLCPSCAKIYKGDF